MANKILHKRNLSTGNNPTTASLDPGELAINVADGKLFLRQSGSVANKIITVGESASFAATASYVNPLNQNVQLTGSLYLSTPGVASIYFTGSGIPGQLTWNDTDGTLELGLKGGVVKTEIGQGLVTRVVNKTVPNVDLSGSNYQVVVVSGAQGQRLAVKLAQADNDANSAGTLGVIAEDIAKNQEGFIITVGLLKNRNTTGALQGETWSDGDILYLSPTTAGAITNIKPQAPQHTVIVGYVEYAHANNGKIYVKIDNGYEIDELHNVRITTASLAPGQLLVRSGSNNSGVWINTNQLTGSYGLTGSLTATQITASGLYAGNTYISGSLTVLGGATIFGSSSFQYVTSSQLAVSASFISVNIFEPAERFGGLKVYDSGSSTATASLAWDSLHNHWVYENVDGATYTGGMLLSGPRNTGSLGDEPTLTKWFVPRSDGGDHLNDSQIFSSGSIHIVTGSLTVTSGVTGSLQGTASYALQALSASYAPDTTFPFTGSAIISGSLQITGSLSILDSLGFNNINTGIRTLYDSPGNRSVDWSSRLLTNTSGNAVVDWRNLRLIDSATTRSVNWEARTLQDSTQTTTVDWGNGETLWSNRLSVQWKDRKLYDSSPILSADWTARTLHDTSTTQSIDWGNRRLLDSGVPGGSGVSETSIDWENRQTIDAYSIFSSDWNIRALYDGASNPSIYWNSRALIDSTGNEVLYWDVANQFNTVNNNFYQTTLVNDLDAFAQNSTNAVSSLTQNLSGEIIKIPGILDAGVSTGNLVYLNSDGIWYKTDQTSISSSYMLGVCVNTAVNREAVFLEGTIGFVTSSIADSPLVTGTNFYGVPIYISGSNGAMSTDKPTSGIVRIVGHAFYNSTTTPTNWLMKFRPSNDWYEI